MTFAKAFADTYRFSIAFLLACPLLALVPVAFEMLQHVAEVHIGMYDSIAAAKATEQNPLRLAFGMVKVLSLIAPGYWITRFLAWRDPRAAARIDPRAVLLYAGVVAFHAALSALQLFALPPTIGVLLAGFAIGQAISGLVPAWTVAAALGNPAIGPVASARLMLAQLPFTVALMLATVLPLMIPHYVLGAAAIFAGRALLWPVLLVDALLVGWLCAVMLAGGYVTAMRAAATAGIALDRAPRPAIAA